MIDDFHVKHDLNLLSYVNGSHFAAINNVICQLIAICTGETKIYDQITVCDDDSWSNICLAD